MFSTCGFASISTVSDPFVSVQLWVCFWFFSLFLFACFVAWLVVGFLHSQSIIIDTQWVPKALWGAIP